MIVPMRKLTVLCLATQRDATLEQLRRFGALHVEPVRMELEEGVETARREFHDIRRAMEILPHKPHTPPSGEAPDAIIHALLDLIRQRADLEEDLTDLRHEEKRIEPMGAFDPAAVQKLAKQGLSVRLFQTDAHRALPAPPDAVVQELWADRSARIFAVIARGSPAVDALELRMPAISLERVREQIRNLETRLQEIHTRAGVFSGDYPALAALRAERENRVRFLEVRSGMETVGAVTYVRGYCPEALVPKVSAAAKTSGWGLRVEEPAEDDPVPTLLENPSWVNPIRTVFEMIGVIPGYREVDISAVFLLFLSLFFAMLVGDAGYGALFLGLTLWVRKTKPNAPPHALQFLAIMSLCTIVWGVLTGAYFGIETLPAVLHKAEIPWLTDPNHVMGLCFLIGALHLTVAHVWNGWRKRRTPQALAQIGWIGITWGMYLAAKMMVLSAPFPAPLGIGLLGGGALLVLLFMTPVAKLKEEWFNHAMFPLALVSAFVDIVSYIRLFAVGTATLAVAQAFNGMAIGEGIHSIGHGLAAALILFLGHTLNVLLAAMGVVVHGVRLNTLEFSGHLEMQWTGTPYHPFARTGTESGGDAAAP